MSGNRLSSIFSDPGWNTLGTAILSTSNCGNPALRLFGFGPSSPDGYGLGYIIKEDGISVYVISSFVLDVLKVICSRSCASSKHLQTRRYLDTLQSYLQEIRSTLIHVHRSANARPAPFIDHAGILRDSKTGRPIKTTNYDRSSSDEEDVALSMTLLFVFLLFQS